MIVLHAYNNALFHIGACGVDIEAVQEYVIEIFEHNIWKNQEHMEDDVIFI